MPAMERSSSAANMQRGAETDLRSRLDLSASLFYTALGEVGDVAGEDQDENGRPIYHRDGFAEALRILLTDLVTAMRMGAQRWPEQREFFRPTHTAERFLKSRDDGTPMPAFVVDPLA